MDTAANGRTCYAGAQHHAAAAGGDVDAATHPASGARIEQNILVA
jgi:hypothetical protein